MSYVYPASDLDQASRLLQLLGSHWAGVYPGQEFIQDYLQARALLEQSLYTRRREVAAAASHTTCSPVRRQRWYKLQLLLSERQAKPLTYGEPGAVYGGPYTYSGPGSLPGFAWAVPAALKKVGWVSNRLTSPAA